jgi:D-alanyl-D-alanine carboxypeptidase
MKIARRLRRIALYGIAFLPRVLVVLLPTGACAPDTQLPGSEPALPFAQELQAAVIEALESDRGDHDIGLSASIFVPGFEIWSGAAGVSHPGVPITSSMLFDVGSVAKNLEAALVLSLAEEGLIGLDDPLSNWLPPLRHVDGSTTVRQLLNHTSGVFNVFENPEFPWVGVEVDYAREWGMEEMFSAFVLEPYGSPGAVQHYASTNYRLLTAIVEKATGQSVPQGVASRFLEPMGLDGMYMTMGPPPPERFEVAHPMVDVNGDGVLEDLAGHSRRWIVSLTHPVLFATPADLVRWIAALYLHHTVLSPSMLAEMLTYPDPEVLDPEGGRYGLGVVDFSGVLGSEVYGHAGSALGYSAAALFLPDHGVAMAWAMNTGESPPELANTLMGNVWASVSSVLFRHLGPGSP